ncbi:MAG: ribosome-associated translation inhibitor RaiA [Chloroflexi bacterium]|nr:ribosome-associated translation inhibitor RaiA [Chloroflexota bacterium]
MQLTVKGKNMEVTGALKDYAEKRISKLTRYFDHIISTDVTLSTERNWHIVEVNVFGDGFSLRGEERTGDMYTSIDKVMDKLEKQVKKQKDKISRRKQKTPEHDFFAIGEDFTSGKEDKPEYAFENIDVNIRRIRAPRLSIEQAIKQLEAEDHIFQVFTNRETGYINILFKRSAGYGILEPMVE